MTDLAPLRLGSLCSGYGGLDLAVEAHTGAELQWCAEIDPHASIVLEERFGVPNLGDFRGQDPDPVDVLTAGFPCQPVSAAGLRRGTNDERWLFDDICTLVGRMEPRPRLLVFENVLGLLSANNGDAMGRVVRGLAGIGYMGSWRVVRASDAGAPHQRARVFIAARSIDAPDPASSRQGDPRRLLDAGVPADARAGVGRGDDPGRAPADAARVGGETRSDAGRDRERVRVEPMGRSSSPADAGERGRSSRPGLCESEPGQVGRGRSADDDRPTEWGPYADAVARWERILGRRAPSPVDDAGRLNRRLVEWMMGLPDGWVCDVIPTRTAALKMLGNGVVPQQALLALRLLGA